MAFYPFPSFSNFTFLQSESPIEGTDTRWQYEVKKDRHANLGSVKDSNRVLAIGSAERRWEAMFEPDRFAELQNLTGVTDELVDWDAPTPGRQNAMLDNVRFLKDEAVVCSDNVTRRKVRARIEMLSQ